MTPMTTARALAWLLVLTACGGKAAQPRPTEPAATDEAAEDEAAVQPRASGATAYVPPRTQVPEGAIDRAMLERVLAAGPGWLLAEVPLQPTFLAKHKFNGFKLLSVFRNDPKVLRFGILPGDIVRAVNGQKIVTPSDLLAVFQRLKTADSLEIAVQRDGVDRQFRFPIVPALGLAAIAAEATPASAP